MITEPYYAHLAYAPSQLDYTVTAKALPIICGIRKLGGKAVILPFGSASVAVMQGFIDLARCVQMCELELIVKTSTHSVVDMLDRLGDKKLSIVFTLHSMNPDLHDYATYKGSYDGILGAIRLLHHGRIKSWIELIVRDNEVDKLKEAAALAQKEAIPIMALPQPRFATKGGLSRDGILMMLEYLSAGKPFFIPEALLRFCLHGGNDPKSPRCYTTNAIVAADIEGRLYHPCRYYRAEAFQLDKPLEKVYMSKPYKRLLNKGAAYPVCLGCTAYDYMMASFKYNSDGYTRLHKKDLHRWKETLDAL